MSSVSARDGAALCQSLDSTDAPGLAAALSAEYEGSATRLGPLDSFRHPSQADTHQALSPAALKKYLLRTEPLRLYPGESPSTVQGSRSPVTTTDCLVKICTPMLSYNSRHDLTALLTFKTAGAASASTCRHCKPGVLLGAGER